MRINCTSTTQPITIAQPIITLAGIDAGDSLPRLDPTVGWIGIPASTYRNAASTDSPKMVNGEAASSSGSRLMPRSRAT